MPESKLLSPDSLIMSGAHSFPLILLTSTLAYITYSLLTALYNLTLHPLAKFPGPKLDGAFDFPRYWYMYLGDSAARFTELHDQYGKVVRVAPNRLSFNTAQSFTDIYLSKGSDGYPLAKDREQYTDSIDPGLRNLVTLDNPTHKKHRRAMTYAFSPSAVREQEATVHSYCTLLMSRLKAQITDPSVKGKVDLVRWLNFTTFDIIGDLAFAESFHCLETGKNSLWMTAVFQNLKVATFMRIARGYPLLNFALQTAIKWSPSVAMTVTKLRKDSQDKMARRLASKTDRKDFTSHFLKHGEGIMTDKDLLGNASLFILAGSETSATLLSGLIYLLLKSPDCMQKVRDEIDAASNDVSEMTFVKEAQLPFLHACIEETFRVYPPVPMELNRVTPLEGATIDGIFVPGNKSVATSHLGTYHSSSNFKDPLEFHPERFLGDKRYAGDDLAALQPFSVGPRNCIGMNLAYAEIRSIVTRVLWNFDISLCAESEGWLDQKMWLLWDKKPLMVKLKDRNRM
ncbi:cytochrome P450 monooxygenase-like protein [Cadophora sp. MPI-SDFR-AT-0126]|nr:cytochrome P450 monooxygenase-like protein [Leotiomycetes sp. MPI-SDFR-AT-0126]